MDTKLYTTQIDLELDAIGSPECIVYLDGMPITFDRVISSPTNYHFDVELTAGTHCLEIKHHNKSAADATTALLIKSLSFNTISSPKFTWAGVYTPEYPEPWATEQGPTLAKELKHTDYLGWNGVWRLEFTAPVFTWIHQVEGLGSIYN